MKLPFSRVRAQLGKLTYPQKFVLISLLFVAPLIAFYPLVSDQTTRIDQYGRKELYGTLYLRPLQHLLRDIQQHKLKAEEYLGGTATPAELAEAQSRIEADFQALQTVHQQYGAALQMSTEPNDLSAKWQTLKASTPTLSKADLLDQHTRLTADIRAVISRVGDTSFLILDPDLDTYYMMDAVLLKLPELQTLLFQTLDLGEDAAVTGEALTADNRTQLILLTGLLESDLNAMKVNVQVGLRSNATGEMQPLIEAPLQETIAATEQFLELIDTRIVSAPTIGVETSDFIAAANRALEANATFYETASQALEIGVQARINSLTLRLIYIEALALAGILVAFLVGLLTMRAISRPLTELAETARRLAGGDLSARVNLATADEVGQVGKAFNEMAEALLASQRRVAERTRALAASAEVSRRLSTILDQQQLVAQVVEQVRAAFNYYHVHIYLFDDPRDNLLMAGGTGEAGRVMLERRHKIPKGRGLVGRAAESNQIVLVPDTSRDPGWLPNPLLPETRSEVAVPIAVSGYVLGVLDVQHDIVDGLQAEDADLIQSLANQVAIALQNARSFTQARQQAEYEALANTIGQKIQSATTPDAVLQVAAQELGKIMGARRATAQISLAKGGNGETVK